MGLLSACNLPQWNQKRLTKKYARKGIEEKVFEKDGHQVHYFEGGEGETVLFIHGFGGDAQVTWNKSITDMAKDHHVIAPDLLWFGQSKSESKPELMSQVDAILALLEDRGVKKCKVVGISYGGFVTLGLVYKKKPMFEKVVIVNSPGMTYDLSLLEDLRKEQNEARFQDIFVLKEPKDLAELNELGLHKNKKIPKKILKDAYELYFAENHKEQDQLLSTLPKEQEKFNQVNIGEFPPTLVLWGVYDKIFPLAEGQKLAKFMDAKFVEVPKAGHASNLDNYKFFQKELRAFLSE